MSVAEETTKSRPSYHLRHYHEPDGKCSRQSGAVTGEHMDGTGSSHTPPIPASVTGILFEFLLPAECP